RPIRYKIEFCILTVANKPELPTKGVQMRSAILVLSAVTVLCLTLVVTAQLPPPQKDQEQAQPARDPGFEAAHERVFQPPDKAGEVGRLTEKVAPSGPASPAAFAPLPHKNYVDDFILGRMERDH